ncbi:MAG: DUF177 domain-containing protein [Deltaproteobacteria bacterium]|nr:DUF177 domain-containing protein [Deltaproteobacteria bacterium]
MESVKNNLIFSLDAWPEAGYDCDFVLSQGVLSDILAFEDCQGETPRILTSMRGHVKLELTGRRLTVKGSFAVKVELLCHRCLSPFDGRVDDIFSDQVNLADPGQGRESAQVNEDTQVISLVGQSFDLAPLMAEFFWLAWPYKALCQTDCAGLCPKCGANLNEGSCYCDTDQPTKH